MGHRFAARSRCQWSLVILDVHIETARFVGAARFAALRRLQNYVAYATKFCQYEKGKTSIFAHRRCVAWMPLFSLLARQAC
jgi:hypothetical protein